MKTYPSNLVSLYSLCLVPDLPVHSYEASHLWDDFLGPLGLELVGVLLQKHAPNSEAVKAQAGLR